MSLGVESLEKVVGRVTTEYGEAWVQIIGEKDPIS